MAEQTTDTPVRDPRQQARECFDAAIAAVEVGDIDIWIAALRRARELTCELFLDAEDGQ